MPSKQQAATVNNNGEWGVVVVIVVGYFLAMMGIIDPSMHLFLPCITCVPHWLYRTRVVTEVSKNWLRHPNVYERSFRAPPSCRTARRLTLPTSRSWQRSMAKKSRSGLVARSRCSPSTSAEEPRAWPRSRRSYGCSGGREWQHKRGVGITSYT